MKILFTIDSLTSGGKERRLTELMKALKITPGCEFELIVMSETIHYREVFDLGIPIHKVVRKRKRDLSVFRKFYKICKAFRPDVIHSWDGMSAIYMIPASRLLHIKLLNGMVVDAPVNRKAFTKYWFTTKIAFFYSHVIIGNSQAGLRAYHAPKRKSVCIYNGFNFRRIAQLKEPSEIRNKFRVDSTYLVLMVGAFGRRKDYDTFIDAAQDITAKRGDVEFVAVGGGGNLTHYSEQVARSGNERIKLLGVQSDVESIIKAADICVLTTNSKVHGEGISNSILEYMAIGKPVVASSGGGTNEIVSNNETGYLIPPFAPAELAENISRLLTDADLRKRMGEAGYQRIRSFFSIESMVNKYLALYSNYVPEESRILQAPASRELV